MGVHDDEFDGDAVFARQIRHQSAERAVCSAHVDDANRFVRLGMALGHPFHMHLPCEREQPADFLLPGNELDGKFLTQFTEAPNFLDPMEIDGVISATAHVPNAFADLPQCGLDSLVFDFKFLVRYVVGPVLEVLGQSFELGDSPLFRVPSFEPVLGVRPFQFPTRSFVSEMIVP